LDFNDSAHQGCVYLNQNTVKTQNSNFMKYYHNLKDQISI